MNFKRGANTVYKTEKKLELAKVVEKYKKQYNEEVEKNYGKTKYNYRRKRQVAVKPKLGFCSKVVWEFYTDMKDVPNYHPDFQWAIKVATCAFENTTDLRDPAPHPVKKARETLLLQGVRHTL